MIGFLRVLIVLIIGTVSAVLFFGLLEMFFHVLVQIRFGCICAMILFDCLLQYFFDALGIIFGYFWVSWVPWGSCWQAFWVPGGPRDTILAPKVNFGGSEGPSWTAGGSRGGSMVKKSRFPPPSLDLFWDHFGVKNHSKNRAEI